MPRKPSDSRKAHPPKSRERVLTRHAKQRAAATSPERRSVSRGAGEHAPAVPELSLPTLPILLPAGSMRARAEALTSQVSEYAIFARHRQVKASAMITMLDVAIRACWIPELGGFTGYFQSVARDTTDVRGLIRALRRIGAFRSATLVEHALHVLPRHRLPEDGFSTYWLWEFSPERGYELAALDRQFRAALPELNQALIAFAIHHGVATDAETVDGTR